MKKQLRYLYLLLYLVSFYNSNCQDICLMNSPDQIGNKHLRSYSITNVCSSIRYIKINIHFMLKTDGTGNFREYDDGLGNTANTGHWYAQELINGANANLANNQKMLFPVGNTIDNPITNIRYILSGVYFHRDDLRYEHTSSNSWTSTLNDIYGVDRNSEINVFFPKSNILNSNGTTLADLGGIASGFNPSIGNYWVKIVDPWWHYKQGTYSWRFTGLFNHEIGHLLNLLHPFQGDDCADTPNNATEWCNGQNNMMDYNCYQNAITPCQLQKMQVSLDGIVEPYRICCSTPPATAMFSMRSHACNGDNIILYGSWRTIKQEQSYSLEIYKTDAVGSNTNIGNYWIQNYSGQYGNINLSSLYSFVAGNTYRVKLTVNSTSCPNTDSEIKWITIKDQTLYLQNQSITANSTLYSDCKYFIGYDVDNTQTLGNVTLGYGGNLKVKSGQSITLSQGTLIENGSTGYFEVDPNSTSYSTTNYKTSQNLSVNLNNNGNGTPTESTNNINTFPNPNTGIFKLTINYPEAKQTEISIKNALGEEIYYKNIGMIKESMIDINIEDKPIGLYFINIKNNDAAENMKILLYR